MKKILSIIAIICVTVLSMDAQRWANAPGDNTGRQLVFASTTVTLATTDSISPRFSETFYTFATLTEAKTIIIKVNGAKKWDRVTLSFTSDNNAVGRTVTFSTTSGGVVNKLWTSDASNELTPIQSKSATITFLYDGNKWTEQTRSVEL